VSPGVVTPGALRAFENYAENFFINVKGGVADDQKVSRLLGCFQNRLIDDWIACNREKLIALTFPKFMETFRDRWLPADWEQSLKKKMVAAKLEPGTGKFEAWVTEVQTLNVGLRGTPSYYGEDQLRTLLDANLDDELKDLAVENGANSVKELVPWIKRMRAVDARRLGAQKRVNEQVAHCVRAMKRPYTPPNDRIPTGTPPPSVGRPASTSPYPPRLTAEERTHL
jgi:hypothetical protein